MEELHLDFVGSTSNTGNDNRVLTSDDVLDASGAVDMCKSVCFCNLVIFENWSGVSIIFLGTVDKI